MFKGALEAVGGEIERAEAALIEADRHLSDRAGRLRQRLTPGRDSRIAVAVGGSALGMWALLRARRRHRAREAMTNGSSAPAAPSGLRFARSLLAPLLSPWLGVQGAQLAATIVSPLFDGGVARDSGPTVAINADVQRLFGSWHELARISDRHERPFNGSVVTQFGAGAGRGEALRAVTSRRGDDGVLHQSVGCFRQVRADDVARMRVSYVPTWLRWLPWAWDHYWLLDVDPQYRWLLAGTPDRSNLWMLSRDKDVSLAQFNALVARAAALGYRVQQLRRTRRE